jgi:hypothetical protein
MKTDPIAALRPKADTRAFPTRSATDTQFITWDEKVAEAQVACAKA